MVLARNVVVTHFSSPEKEKDDQKYMNRLASQPTSLSLYTSRTAMSQIPNHFRETMSRNS